MRTVLGLSVTTAGVGWVLVDATTPDGRPLDHDGFTVDDSDDLVLRCLAAVRGAAGIAAASGHRIAAIGVCWSADLEAQSSELLTALRGVGCADVRPVRHVKPTAEGLADCAACPGDPSELLAQLLDDDGGVGADADVDADLAPDDLEDVDCGPAAGQTPAFEAAHAVLTNAVPPAPVSVPTARRGWSLPTVGARVPMLAGAAAVTAVIAMLAVGSQFGGAEMPESTALANRASMSTAQTSPIVSAQAPPAPAPQPLAAPAEAGTSAVPRAVPQAAPTAAWVPPAEPVVEQVPAVRQDSSLQQDLSVPQDTVPVEAQPVVPEVAPVAVDPVAVPGAAHLPVPPPAAPPPPPAPFALFAPAPPPPAPLPAPPAPPAPMAVPAPPAPEPFAAPAAPAPAPMAAPVPPPPAPVNPIFGALP